MSGGQLDTQMADLQTAAEIRAFEGLSRADSIRPNNTYFTTVLDEQKISYLDAKEAICLNVTSAEDCINQLEDDYVFMKALNDKAFTKSAVGIAQQGDTYQVHILLLEE